MHIRYALKCGDRPVKLGNSRSCFLQEFLKTLEKQSQFHYVPQLSRQLMFFQTDHKLGWISMENTKVLETLSVCRSLLISISFHYQSHLASTNKRLFMCMSFSISRFLLNLEKSTRAYLKNHNQARQIDKHFYSLVRSECPQ